MIRKRHLPNWLYEPLPFVYIGCGILVIIKVGSAWAISSGLLLVSAGIMVWRSRRVYRVAAQSRPKGQSAQQDTATRRHPNLLQLVWSAEYECGNNLIDTQHRKLFSLSNEILNDILDDKPHGDVELLLDELVEHIKDHFAAEEALLADINHPLEPEHQEAHRRLVAQCDVMKKRFHNGDLKVGELFQFMALSVISEHIINEDLKCLTGIE